MLVANFRVGGAKLHLSIPQQRRPETRIVDSHTLRAWPAADRPAMLDPTCLSLHQVRTTWPLVFVRSS